MAALLCALFSSWPGQCTVAWIPCRNIECDSRTEVPLVRSGDPFVLRSFVAKGEARDYGI